MRLFYQAILGCSKLTFKTKQHTTLERDTVESEREPYKNVVSLCKDQLAQADISRGSFLGLGERRRMNGGGTVPRGLLWGKSVGPLAFYF